MFQLLHSTNILSCFKVPANEVYELLKRDVASIILIVHGQCKINETPKLMTLSTGKVFMVPANTKVKVHVGFELLELYQTFVNV